MTEQMKKWRDMLLQKKELCLVIAAVLILGIVVGIAVVHRSSGDGPNVAEEQIAQSSSDGVEEQMTEDESDTADDQSTEDRSEAGTIFAEDDENQYYLKAGVITAISKKDGSTVWVNSDSGKSSKVHFAFGEDGTLYLTFSIGTLFMAIDREGNTISKIDGFSPEYDHSANLEIVDGKIRIEMWKVPEGCENAIWLSLSDYSHIHYWIEESPEDSWICSICGEKELTPDVNSADYVIGDVGENLIYFIRRNTLYAINKEDGSEAWSKEVHLDTEDVKYALDGDNILYLIEGTGSDSQLLSIDTNGNILRSMSLSTLEYDNPSALELIDQQAVITMDVCPEGAQDKIYINTEDFSHEHIWAVPSSDKPAGCLICGIFPKVSENFPGKEDYRDAILRLESVYGQGEVDIESRAYNGVCYAELMDLDRDGAEEMIVIAGDITKEEYYIICNYKVYIYSYQNGRLKVAEFEGTDERNGLINYDGGSKFFKIVERDGTYYIVTTNGLDERITLCYYELTRDKRLSLHQAIPTCDGIDNLPKEVQAVLVSREDSWKEEEQYQEYRHLNLNYLYGKEGRAAMDSLNQTRNRLGLEQIVFQIESR